MQKNELQRKTKRAKSVQVGRGGKRGKTAGRGTKGQKARAGHSIRPEWRDTIKRLPKLRGRGVNSNKSIKTPYVAFNLTDLDAIFEKGGDVNPTTLKEMGVLKNVKGRPAPVKILGTGETTKKFTITNCAYSQTAKEKIEKAGGSVQ